MYLFGFGGMNYNGRGVGFGGGGVVVTVFEAWEYFFFCSMKFLARVKVDFMFPSITQLLYVDALLSRRFIIGSDSSGSFNPPRNTTAWSCGDGFIP